LFAGHYPPSGWHLCDGSLLKINDYQALYALIGVTYGGDGVTTFAIPDLQGRVPIGQGQGTGLTNRVVGQKGGAETVQLQAANIAAHNHSLRTAGVAATTPTPGSTVTYANTASPTTQYLVPGLGSAAAAPVNPIASTISDAGYPGPTPHENVMPTAVLTYMIALNGIFPTRA
jgi:microcystin-dependent protein